jgi:hypothetical protein
MNYNHIIIDLAKLELVKYRNKTMMFTSFRKAEDYAVKHNIHDKKIVCIE